MCVQDLKFVALPLPGIIGQSVDTPTRPFLQNFEWAFVWMDLMNVLAIFEVRSFTRS